MAINDVIDKLSNFLITHTLISQT